jgi:hypothetical protein
MRIPDKIRIFAAPAALLFLATCQTLPSDAEIAATAATIPDPNDLRRVINENRFFRLRPKARRLVLDHWDDTNWALATTLNGCPSPWHIRWGGGGSNLDGVRRVALEQCEARVGEKFPQTSLFSTKNCSCRIVAENGRMSVPRNELPQFLWSPVTWFSRVEGRLVVQHGMMGIEQASVVSQTVILLDREGDSFCEGRFEISDDQQTQFKMNCKNLNLDGEGSVEVKNLLSGKRHAVGLSQSNRGERFAWVTTLMPSEVRSTYPELYDPNFYK